MEVRVEALPVEVILCMSCQADGQTVLKIGTDLNLAGSNLVTEAEEQVSSPAINEEEDMPDPGIESVDPDTASDTDLEDPVNASNPPNVEHFMFVLQEAQLIAVELKRGEEKQKQKMPKTNCCLE